MQDIEGFAEMVPAEGFTLAVQLLGMPTTTASSKGAEEACFRRASTCRPAAHRPL
jgi:hypothetical protein